MSKKTSKEKIEVKSNTKKYVLETKNTSVISWKTFAPWLHNIEKWVYDAMKWANHPKMRVFIKK